MKKRSFFQLTFMLALCFMFTACSKNEDKTLETDKNKDAKIEVDYKDGYEIAKHENFDDEDDFREVDIYLEGTISKFEDGDVYIKDSAGYEWAVIYTRNHDFEPYIGKKCVCYCRASGVWTAQEDIVLISFEEKKDYKMIIDDDIIYSEFDNCTFHHSYGKDYIAFGGYGDDMISEYHVFDLKENTVRYIRNKDDKWYYAEAKYKGLIFHDVEVEYSDDFLESMEMVDNNRGLLYFINHGTGLIAPLVDADELNTKFNTLKKKDAIKKISGSPDSIDEDSNVLVAVPEESKEAQVQENRKEEMVWIPTAGGTKYHSNSSCSKMKNPKQVTLETAIAQGFTACKRCH